MDKSIKQVPTHIATLTVVPAQDLITAFVAVVVCAGVFVQQVVDQLAARWRQIQLTTDFGSLVIQQVTGRVEGERFNALTRHGAEQAADGIVAIGERAATTVVIANKIF